MGPDTAMLSAMGTRMIGKPANRFDENTVIRASRTDMVMTKIEATATGPASSAKDGTKITKTTKPEASPLTKAMEPIMRSRMRLTALSARWKTSVTSATTMLIAAPTQSHSSCAPEASGLSPVRISPIPAPSSGSRPTQFSRKDVEGLLGPPVPAVARGRLPGFVPGREAPFGGLPQRDGHEGEEADAERHEIAWPFGAREFVENLDRADDDRRPQDTGADLDRDPDPGGPVAPGDHNACHDQKGERDHRGDDEDQKLAFDIGDVIGERQHHFKGRIGGGQEDREPDGDEQRTVDIFERVDDTVRHLDLT